MVLSLTALVELFGAFSFGILAYRFWQVFNERKSFIPRLLFYFVGTLAFYFFFDSFLILFFAGNSFALKLSVIYGVFFQSLACAFLAYLSIYILNPKINPIFGFLFIFILGSIAILIAIFTPFFPSLKSIGQIKVVNWDLPLPIGLLQSLIFLTTFVPLIFIFLFYSQISKANFIKTRSIGMAVIFLLGLNAGLVNFFGNFLKLSPLSGDISLGAFSLFLFLLLLYFSFQSKESEGKA